MNLIGVFLNLSESDPENPERKAVLHEGLGRNDVEYEFRYGEAKYDRYRDIARELIELNPALLIATCGPSYWALQQQTSTIPIVFTSIIDPARTGRKPGPNAWGGASYLVTHSAKWVTLLKRMAPNVERLAVVADFHIDRPAATEETIEIREAAQPMTVARIDLNGTDEAIAGKVVAFAGEQNGGLIVAPGTLAGTKRDFIIGLAREHRLPARYGNRLYVNSGGLFSYGPTTLALYREAGAFASRILDGQRPPENERVKYNDQFELVINRAAAEAIGLTVPQDLLSEADETINGA